MQLQSFLQSLYEFLTSKTIIVPLNPPFVAAAPAAILPTSSCKKLQQINLCAFGINYGKAEWLV